MHYIYTLILHSLLRFPPSLSLSLQYHKERSLFSLSERRKGVGCCMFPAKNRKRSTFFFSFHINHSPLASTKNSLLLINSFLHLDFHSLYSPLHKSNSKLLFPIPFLLLLFTPIHRSELPLSLSRSFRCPYNLRLSYPSTSSEQSATDP